MNQELTFLWKQVEADYTKFCLDFFDEKPIVITSFNVIGEPIMFISGKKTEIFEALEVLIITVLRVIFVKKYDVSIAVDQVLKKLEKPVRRVKTRVVWSAEFLLTQFSVYAQRSLIMKLGFT